MNCRAAQRLMSAERDGALATGERADLESHLAGCADCRQARAAVAGAINRWRATQAKVAVPDSERAWQDIRREIRRGAPADAPGVRPFPRWALATGAAAAVIVAVAFGPRWSGGPVNAEEPRAAIARADFVETAGNSSSMVYVDDKSGWLVVWAVNDHETL